MLKIKLLTYINLLKIKITDNNLFNFGYIIIMNMMDDKINALTKSLYQLCFIYKCNPTNINKLDKKQIFEINK